MLIWLASYPRSGNTLLRRLIHVCTGWNTYSLYRDPYLKDRRDIGHVTLHNHNRFIRYWSPETPAPYPMFCKTHEEPVIHGPRHRAVLLVRDGRDVAVSYANYLSQYEGMDYQQTLRKVINGSPTHRGSWSYYVNLWMISQSIVIVRFEDLLEEMSAGAYVPIVKLFDALGLPTDQVDRSATMPNFGKLKQKDPKFYRSGTAGQWKEILTKEQAKTFWKVHGRTLARLGYEE